VDYDAIVVGGGHAGIEASLAIARLGFSTLLLTQSVDTIGRLSCNPAVGGLSKGNIVREIDALGGEMARLIDASMIQFRILNRRKGPAVQAPRAQADKELYAVLARRSLEQQKDLDIYQDTVVDFLVDSAGGKVEGVVTGRGRQIGARVVVLTTGTFMEARIFIGEYSVSSGRLGEPAAVGLGGALRERGFKVARLKTGTPARVARESLNFQKMELQQGDEEMQPFSFSLERVERPSVPCYITYTNERTHEIIRQSMDRSPLYSGKIVGKGPRYCPSIEDKVVKFPDRERHHIFVEPESLETNEMYLNGISSSLPEEIQESFLKTIPGLEHVHIVRPGYAVEYDFLDPLQLTADLQSKRLAGLFVAGQTNGTSGYEEAACQGVMAGINAVRLLQHQEPIILSRAEAYTGVLIDDLVTIGTEEPYRMFTSRAEYRMNLRHDSADLRLAAKAREVGLLGEEGLALVEKRRDGIDEIKELLKKRRLGEKDLEGYPDFAAHVGKTFYQVLKAPEVGISDLRSLDAGLDKPATWMHTAELDVKYEGYIARQDRQIQKFQKLEWLRIPKNFDFTGVDGLSKESIEKLESIKPASVGQASRISGVRNGDIALLMVSLGRKRAPEET
jgi:tRNA uridine 5-carboxymethylaminomethyl modification enzyme